MSLRNRRNKWDTPRHALAWPGWFALSLALACFTVCALWGKANAAEWQTYLSEDFSGPETMFYSGAAGTANYYLGENGTYIVDGLNSDVESLSALTDGLYYYYLEAECELLDSSADDLAFCGLVFHYNKRVKPGQYCYYVFYIYGDGYYGVKRVLGDEIDIVLPLNYTEYLEPGAQNVLGVDAQGTRFDLYVNGRYVNGFTDVRVDGGGFGFYVSKFSRAAFDNFKVKVERRGGYEPQDSPTPVENNGATTGSPSVYGYTPPVIPRDPNRPVYPWEVGVDKSGKPQSHGEPAAPADSGPPSDSSLPEASPIAPEQPSTQPAAAPPAEASPASTPSTTQEQEPALAQPAITPETPAESEALAPRQIGDPFYESFEPQPMIANGDGDASSVTLIEPRELTELVANDAEILVPVESPPALEDEAPPVAPETTPPANEEPWANSWDTAIAVKPGEEEPQATPQPTPGIQPSDTEFTPEPAAVEEASAREASEAESNNATEEPTPELDNVEEAVVEDIEKPPDDSTAPVLEQPFETTAEAADTTPPPAATPPSEPGLSVPSLDSAAEDTEGMPSLETIAAELAGETSPVVDEEPAAEEPISEPSQPTEEQPEASAPSPAELQLYPETQPETPSTETIEIPESPATGQPEVSLAPAEDEPGPAVLEPELLLPVQPGVSTLTPEETPEPAIDEPQTAGPQDRPSAPEGETDLLAEPASGLEATPTLQEDSASVPSFVLEPKEPAEQPIEQAATDGFQKPWEPAETTPESAAESPHTEVLLELPETTPDEAPEQAWEYSGTSLTELMTPEELAGDAGADYFSGEHLVLVTDDFSAPRWPVSDAGTCQYRYFGAAYEIDNLNATTMAISFQEHSLADMQLAVDVEYLDGVSYVGYGAAARFSYDTGSGAVSYYGLFISQSGEYLILKVKASAEHVLQDWTACSVLNPSQPNRIQLEAVGNTLNAYINGHLVATLRDGDVRDGGYALLAGPGTYARFDNLELKGFPTP